MNLRIGNGYDVHAFAEGRKLILGGVEIPHTKGLIGHSDADVLLHAITDAVLGALCLGDIGSWFPDTDRRYKNADSGLLLKEVWNRVREQGWSLVNCDCVVMAERPKLVDYKQSIRASISKLFACQIEQVSVKATTTEKLGFIGREEGIAASAVVLLSS